MDVPEANQRLQPIRDQFFVRFYRWSNEVSRQEFDEGFPFVSRIRNLNVLRLLNFTASLSRNERALLCSALLKRFHQRAVELLEDFPSLEEDALLNRYSAASDVQALQLAASAPGFRKANFRKMVLKKLGQVLGDPVEMAPNRETWTYEAQIGCWMVRTGVDIGGRRNVGYGHTISAREAVHLQHHISVLSWMGISSQTDWIYLSEAESDEAAECLGQLCRQFLNAVPKLLEGLTHDLPEPDVREWRELVTVKGHRQSGMTIVALDTPELRKAFRGKATWDIPTSIIPERLRAVGSHFAIVQDPAFSRESPDPLAVSTTYRHVRVELLDKRSRA
jgi:hypothetical protein